MKQNNRPFCEGLAGQIVGAQRVLVAGEPWYEAGPDSLLRGRPQLIRAIKRSSANPLQRLRLDYGQGTLPPWWTAMGAGKVRLRMLVGPADAKKEGKGMTTKHHNAGVARGSIPLLPHSDQVPIMRLPLPTLSLHSMPSILIGQLSKWD